MPRTIALSTGTFDRTNTFRVDVGKRFHATCSLHRDYQKQGDGIYWAMQHAACISSHYSDEEIAEKDRLASEAPLQNGDTVLIDGNSYTVRVLGDYSNAAIFDPA